MKKLLTLCMVLLAWNLSAADKPNVVIIFLDDAGWADFEPFGKPEYKTPNVAKMAAEGTRFTQFYVPQAICSASRSALMSGCYPGRTKVFGAHGPNGKGLSTKFATMAEIFKQGGYATAHFGKWHCGDTPQTRPHARGFGEHAGLMYSNDMWKHHPMSPKHWGKFPLKFWENGKVKVADVGKQHQEMLTTWATEKSVDFIKRNKEKPFFLYLAHSMPHVPLFCSDKFRGKSGVGLYGDVMMELDWSVGQVMKTLEENGLDENTIVIFSSDNGPWAGYGNRAGKTPFREAKATSFDGGTRSPLIIKFPSKVKAGIESKSVFCTIDMLPSLSKLCGLTLPQNEIDGKNVLPLIFSQPGAKNPQPYYAFSTGKKLEAILSSDGRWKLHLPHSYRTIVEVGKDGFDAKYSYPKIKLALYDLKTDAKEEKNLIGKFPEIAQELKQLAEEHRKKFYRK